MNTTQILSIKENNNVFLSGFLYSSLLNSFSHCLMLVGFIIYQFVQPDFLNAGHWIFIYMVLFSVLTIDGFIFSFYEKIKKQPFIQHLYLSISAVLMTLCLSTPVFSPLLALFYLIHIGSGGFMFGYKGAFSQGLLISALFSCLLIVDPAYAGPNTFLSFALHNAGFLMMAVLSGFLGDQALKQNWFLEKAQRVIEDFKNINQQIVENTDLGFFVLDKDMRIVFSNAKIKKWFNVSSEVTALHSVLPELRQFMLSHQSKDHFKMELSSLQKTLEFSVSPFGENKQLVLVQDKTDWQKVEKKQQEEEKWEGIGRMAEGLAREIKKPLKDMDTALSKTQENTLENEEFNPVLKSAKSLGKVIHHFLDYAGSPEQVYQAKAPLSLSSLLEEVLESFLKKPRWNHIHHHVILKSCGQVAGNKNDFKQIFSHLIKNALEAMESSKEGKLSVESFDDNEWAVVRIKNEGQGIRKEDKEKIYEPFYSTKKRGAGLGLCIVKKKAELYNCRFFLENLDTGGAVCTLRFPIQPNNVPGERALKISA